MCHPLSKEAQSLSPEIDLDPSTGAQDNDPKVIAQRGVAAAKLQKAQSLTGEGKIEEAIALYKEIQKFTEITANQWNLLCWNGSLHRHAADVMFACEKAVELEPENASIRDSRGLARALTGDKEGAINDFQDFIDERPYPEGVEQRKKWIQELNAGRDPFTEDEVLENLL